MPIFLYDDNGQPVGMQYRNTAYAANTFDTYWFEKNLQGDIVAVYSNAVMTMSIDDDERDSLIINKLIDENIIESKDIDLDILSARQSLYQGKEAIIYVVKLTDPQGYTVVHTLAVYNS